jgi:hypothetical protein
MMNRKEHHRHLDINVGGRAVARADVELHDPPGVVRAVVHVESGHQPPKTRAGVVDAVLDLPEVRAQQRLEIAVPIGETEILQRLRERCERVRTRPAGATCLVDADLPWVRRGPRPRHTPHLRITTDVRVHHPSQFA